MIKKKLITISLILISTVFNLNCQTGNKNFKTNLKKKNLQNGIEVLSFKDQSLPSFQIIVWSSKGSAYEPIDQQGITHLTANLLIEGSLKHTKKEISQKFTNLGASFLTSVLNDQIIFTAQGLTEDSLEITKLFTEVILSPKFDNNSILDVKLKKTAEIKSMADDPKTLAKIAFSQLMFQKHEYSKFTTGSLKSLPKLKRSEVLKRYDQIMEAKNLKIAFIGDWSEDAEAFILSRFTDLKKEIQETKLNRVKVAEKIKESVLFHKKDLQQANISIGFSAIDRSSEDYEALKVGLSVLGGSFKSRLNQELRIKSGLTYGVYANLLAMQDGGIIGISGGVRHNKVLEFITKAKKIIADTAVNGITQIELDKTIAIMKGQFLRNMETKEQEANLYLDLVSRGIKGELLYTYLNKIINLNLTDVNDALRKYLIIDHINILILANKYKIPKVDRKKLKLLEKDYSKIKF